MKLDEAHPAHQKMLAQLRADAAARVAEGDEAEPELAPYEAGPHSYLGRGSHPDVVTRVWDVLGAALPEDGRRLVFGTPALVHPGRGLVLAMAYGTEYLLCLPPALASLAIERGYKTKQQWSTGDVTDVAEAFGPGWVFGRWLEEEADWIRAAFRTEQS